MYKIYIAGLKKEGLSVSSDRDAITPTLIQTYKSLEHTTLQITTLIKVEKR